jgi:hypothetical protein
MRWRTPAPRPRRPGRGGVVGELDDLEDTLPWRVLLLAWTGPQARVQLALWPQQMAGREAAADR